MSSKEEYEKAIDRLEDISRCNCGPDWLCEMHTDVYAVEAYVAILEKKLAIMTNLWETATEENRAVAAELTELRKR